MPATPMMPIYQEAEACSTAEKPTNEEQQHELARTIPRPAIPLAIRAHKACGACLSAMRRRIVIFARDILVGGRAAARRQTR